MIFYENAKKYWDAGLPAIPLIAEQKRPAIGRWQLFADAFPTEEEKKVWLDNYPDGNIGMPMGASSGLIAVDIDTDDPKVLRVLDELLPSSPWVRVGKKGNIKVYRFNGERTTRIKASDGSMICEILSKGTQFVLPPSIHPDTHRPYTANCNLYEVHKSVPSLPPGIEDLIRGALKDVGVEVSVGGAGAGKIATYVPAGARDNTMVWHAGLLARAVLRGERTLLQALGEMEDWVTGFVEQVVGDPLTVEKAQKKLIEFLIKDVTGERRLGLPSGWDEGMTDEDKQKIGIGFTTEDEKWSAEQIISYLRFEFERFDDPHDEGRLTAINVALDKIARASGMISILDEERTLKFIQAQSMNTISLGSLKKQLGLLRRGDIAGENHQEVAQAVLKFISEYGEIRYDAGSFWQWKGAFWERRENAGLMSIISSEFGAYPACRRHSDYMGVLKVMMSIATKSLCQVNIRGLNFANGFLTEDIRLIDHNPDHGMTYVMPYRYMPELAGHMPMFNQYLADSWEDDADYMDKIMALQEAIGASLFGYAPTFQRAFCLFGQPGSGKSQVSTIVRGLLPDGVVSSVPPQDWGDKFLPTQLFGKVINFAGELSETRAIPGDIFKQIIEGEQISGQYKNQDIFHFRPSCAHWFNSNFLPKSRDTSDGFNRRWLILEWNKRVPQERRINDLANVILEYEREAIVAWAVVGFERLRKNREYTLPSSHMACVDQMATDNNSVRYFLTTSPLIIVGRQRTEGLTNNSITATELHSAYWSFCIGIGSAQRVSLQVFQRMMKELQPVFGFTEVTTKKPEIVYQYITLVGSKKPSK